MPDFQAGSLRTGAAELSDFDVLVSTSGLQWTSVYYGAGAAGEQTAVAVNLVARYVRVQLRGTGHLSLAEVQLFGAPLDAFAWGKSGDGQPGDGSTTHRNLPV